MNANWKRFWIGVLAALAAVGGALLAIFSSRRSRPGGAPAEIAADAERKIAEARARIKADSDAELADRFNRLGEKKENHS
jgi:hypothetical protein